MRPLIHTLRPLALTLVLAAASAQAQTPAAPTPTTPPEGIRPAVTPAPAPPTFNAAPPMAAPEPPRPLAAPAPPAEGPRARARSNVDCTAPSNKKLPICNEHKDPEIQRAPSTAVDPKFSRTPPPTGDGVAKGADKIEPPAKDAKDPKSPLKGAKSGS